MVAAIGPLLPFVTPGRRAAAFTRVAIRRSVQQFARRLVAMRDNADG